MIKVSNIERFAIHDGPGIRTTVFLKGCPLHCPWCANPETWQVDPILMHDERKCARCHQCLDECDQGAISFGPAFKVDHSKCNACGKCVDVCIPDALSINGMDMDRKEIIELVSKDDDYYEHSHGGITLSGGEPLFQFDEVKKLIQLLKDKKYHVAIETTGMYSLQHLKEVEPYIDLFLFDVKHIDEKKLREVVGANKEVIFTNLEYLSTKCPEKVIVRVPVIPGFNRDCLTDMIGLAKKMHFKEVNLLPYHSMGKNKWDHLQKTYAYEDMKMMEKKELEDYISFGQQNEIVVKIGG